MMETTQGNQQVAHLREKYPVFQIERSTVQVKFSTVNIDFVFTVGGRQFKPRIQIHGLRSHEVKNLRTETARRLIRGLSVIEALSYWKAFCSPVIEIADSQIDQSELDWWQAFCKPAMGEFYYRNHIDFTSRDFLTFRSTPSDGPMLVDLPCSSIAATQPHIMASPLIMFSGGKDSLALALTVGSRNPSIDYFLYNPTPSQIALAESLSRGQGRTFRVQRKILPELLKLNAAGRPNGHTPYSAYLGFVATLVGYLRGNQFVLAGNSRSDDDPNVDSYLGHEINHQWTKTYEFESRFREYRDRWVPDAPTYSSPFRPLLELQVLSSLSEHIDTFLQTSSCNRLKGIDWCRECAKCAWVFLATSAAFNIELAVKKFGANLFDNPKLADTYSGMAGFDGVKPFECTGTEEEVRVCIRHILDTHQGSSFPAFNTCAQKSAVLNARSLEDLLQDWGQDDLIPPFLIDLLHDLRRSAGRQSVLMG